jgi:hypothetical protein
MAVNDLTFDEANEALHKKHVDNDLEEEPVRGTKEDFCHIYFSNPY